MLMLCASSTNTIILDPVINMIVIIIMSIHYAIQYTVCTLMFNCLNAMNCNNDGFFTFPIIIIVIM